jgi:hypothetical protein
MVLLNGSNGLAACLMALGLAHAGGAAAAGVSVATARYYVKKRRIPTGNVLHAEFPPAVAAIDRASVATGCERTALNPFFDSSSRRPQSELGLRPTMRIAADSSALAEALIDRAVAADRSRPPMPRQGTFIGEPLARPFGD